MASDNDIDRGKIGSWCEETMSLNKEQTHHTGTSLIALRDQDARKRRRRELYAEEGKELRNKRRREQRLNKTMNQIMNKEDRKFSRRNLLIAEGMINDGYYKNKECADHANYIGNHSLPRSSSAPGRGTNHANHIGNHSLPCSSSAPGRDGAFDLNMCEHSNNSGHDDEAVMQKKKKGAQVSCREYYCYKLQGKYWSPRKKGFVVGRIVAANPTEGERFMCVEYLNSTRMSVFDETEEDQFFDSRDEITYVSNLGSECSEFCSSPILANCALGYEVWTEKPERVDERRN